MVPIRPRRKKTPLLTTPLEIAMTILVSPGSSSFAPKSLNIVSKPGITKTSKMVSTRMKTTMTMLGYAIAPFTWRLSFIAFSM
jgi:hypothetical protein